MALRPLLGAVALGFLGSGLPVALRFAPCWSQLRGVSSVPGVICRPTQTLAFARIACAFAHARIAPRRCVGSATKKREFLRGGEV